MIKFFIVFLGGGLGSLLRYSVSIFFDSYINTLKIFSTLSVNILGSLLIGISLAFFEKYDFLQNYRLLLMIGVLGGFTTFSTFALENLNLFREGSWKLGIFYIFASNIGAVLSASIGYFGIKTLLVS